MKPIIIANWKMSLGLRESVELAQEMKDKLASVKEKDVVLCPDFVSLADVGQVISGSQVVLGAQDIFWQEKGAYTGEIAVSTLKEIGCKYVIVGHSERRHNLNETGKMINGKIEACLKNGLVPVVCVGETIEDHQDGQTDNVVAGQLRETLEGIDLIEGEEIILAYEPAWAISSGKGAEAAQAEEIGHVFQVMRQAVLDSWPLAIANNNVRLIYGGSVDVDNVEEFANLDMLSGFLVGGASLDAGEFSQIVKLIK